MAKFLLKAGKEYVGNAADGTRKLVKAGEILETTTKRQEEFCRKYPDRYQEVRSNAYPVPPKAAPAPKNEVQDTETVEIDIDKLEKMDTRQLLTFARENSIDIKGAVKREDILKKIKEASTEE
jgi:hypothetical protein